MSALDTISAAAADAARDLLDAVPDCVAAFADAKHPPDLVDLMGYANDWRIIDLVGHDFDVASEHVVDVLHAARGIVAA